MTLLGKILTGLILVMSILFMGFSIAVYATHRNWEQLVNSTTPPLGLIQQLRNERDERRVLQEQVDETLRTLEKERAARRLQLAGLQAQLQRMSQDLRDRDEENTRLIEQQGQMTIALQTAQSNLSRLKDEVDELRKNIRTAQLDRDNQFQEVIRKTDLLNQAISEKEILQVREKQLLDQVGRMTAVLDKNELTEFDPIIDIPPPLEGRVVEVGASNLVEISVGSDDGIRKGHELDVSRGDRYLGRIVIVEAFANRAVGEIVPELRKGRIQRGDRVFTKV